MTQIPEPLTKWVLPVLLMGLFITNVDIAVVNVATPSIHESLNAYGSELQFVVSGYVLSYAMLLITGARLGDMYGYRQLFISGLGLFTLASLACGLAPSAIVLILARVVQGVGAALMAPQVLTGIQQSFAGPSKFARLTSTRSRCPLAPSLVRFSVAFSSPRTFSARAGGRSFSSIYRSALQSRPRRTHSCRQTVVVEPNASISGVWAPCRRPCCWRFCRSFSATRNTGQPGHGSASPQAWFPWRHSSSWSDASRGKTVVRLSICTS
jgi:Major Facilitator Superfamily